MAKKRIKEMKDLVEKYPNVFKLFFIGTEGRPGPHWGCQTWGFECGEGWEKPLEKCAAKLEEEILKQPVNERAYAVQVKQKFGGLRFYLNGTVTAKMNEIIAEAEKECNTICEYCGKPATLQTGRWLVTACDDCMEKP